jgi:hypothetical protein
MILRPVLLLHRWLGIIVGALMTVWCLSGFVMMYVDYPRLTAAEQLRGLAPPQLPAADALDRLDLPTEAILSSVKLEMMAERPVLRAVPATDPSRQVAQMRMTPGSYDLSSGRQLDMLSLRDARAIGATFGQQSGVAGKLAVAAITDMDQWTVQTFRRNQPLYRIAYDDPAGTTIYVAGNSGEVVQQATRFERFWGWLGAVPHWLYPTILRQDGALWDKVVVWISLTGCFLTATGLWIGLARLRRKRDGRIGSPYSGLWWWHHVFGLFFGVLTLTWVASGLFSMNPWGFLDSTAGLAERQRLAGNVRWGEVRSAIGRIGHLPAGTVRLESAPLNGRIFLVAIGADGRMTRLDWSGHGALLNKAALVQALRNGPPVGALDLLRGEDAYYYQHKFTLKFPVWRAILQGPEATRLYIDPDSGQLIRAFDRNARGFRWLQDGLHSLDFPILRSRPLWDIVVLPLLIAVTFICGTGTWMGLRKVARDIRAMRRRKRWRARSDDHHDTIQKGAQP